MSSSSSSQEIINITQQELDQRYKYIEGIDYGTYGFVSKFQDLQNNDLVALKTLKFQDQFSFQQQCAIMKQIDHQNVLKCIACYYNTTKKQSILVTPFCQNKNLKDNINKIAEFSQDEKIRLCLQLAKGINALHQRNIMHRDIKPANILIDKNWTLKLCDFGFGKFEQNNLSQTVRVGTPLYRDPNINSGRYTKKCDIYSIGLVFDTIFRGKGYFLNSTQSKFLKQLLHFKENKKKIIDQLDCCQQMKDIIFQCLQNNENHRMDSKQLLARIQQLCNKRSPILQKMEKAQNIIQFQVQSNGDKIVSSINKLQKNCQQKIQADNAFKKSLKHNKNQSACKLGSNTIIQQPDCKDFREIKLRKYNSGSPLQTKKSSTTTKPIQNNFKILLFQTEQLIRRTIQKASNLQQVYWFFKKRVQNSRCLSLISGLKSVPKNDMKIIVFIGLFGYLKFLSSYQSLFKDKKSTSGYIKSIGGIKLQNISQLTIKKCLQLIENELVICTKAIKPFLVDLNEDKSLYKQKLTKAVLRMINQGIQRKFSTIVDSEPQFKQIQHEFLQLIFHSRYEHYSDDKQMKLKQQIVESACLLFTI